MNNEKKFLVAGEVLLLIPTILILILGFGEVVGGTISGIQHFFQAVPLLLLGYFAWKRPNLGGKIILGGAVILAVVYFFTFTQFPLFARVINASLLFGLPLVAGFLFYKAGNR